MISTQCIATELLLHYIVNVFYSITQVMSTALHAGALIAVAYAVDTETLKQLKWSKIKVCRLLALYIPFCFCSFPSCLASPFAPSFNCIFLRPFHYHFNLFSFSPPTCHFNCRRTFCFEAQVMLYSHTQWTVRKNKK